MMTLDGPSLCRAIRSRDPDLRGVHYEYVNDDPVWSTGKTEVRKWRKVPAWGASRIRVRASYVDTDPARLPALERKLAEMPGCVSAEQIVGHSTRRPHVVAMFTSDAPVTHEAPDAQ